MGYKSILISGALIALLGVVIGAFGAHALEDVLKKTEYGEQFETGSKYHFYHAFALLFCGLMLYIFKGVYFSYASIFFIIGILLFSGSLYIMGITGIRKLGMITPIGGLSFIIGWTIMIIGFVKLN